MLRSLICIKFMWVEYFEELDIAGPGGYTDISTTRTTNPVLRVVCHT
jgi:hypothetical protein